ncbi:hypothetical protein [Pseudoduganella aquatica]|uniref:Uncharacterized protein n=1 Tax=Pseudoduganella aquatica TaxID=2660641 RepID=A0A7X4HFP6_9BURK|nr:hypothetical protein [Pseudoduganella aquatica]MYN10114.1 hypothetical protein [Pseudoduganella aquatica]
MEQRPTIFASRTIHARTRTPSGFGEWHTSTIKVGVVELCEHSDPYFRYCAILNLDNQFGDMPIFGHDQISTLISVMSRISTYCDALAELGEVKLESGKMYDPELHGIAGQCKRLASLAASGPLLKTS